MFMTLTDVRRVLVLTFALACAAPPAGAESLLEIYRMAEQKDPAFRESRANLSAVAENVTQAKGNVFRPVIAVQGAGSRNRQDVQAAFGNTGRTVFNSRSLSIGITQPVYYYDRWMRVEQANQEVAQAEVQVAVARQDLVVRVAERYFDILAAEDNLEFAKAEENSLRRQLEQIEQRFEVGLTAITDVQEARAGYDRAAAATIVAQNQLENAIEALRETTGVYYADLAPLGEDLELVQPEPAKIDAWTELAVQQNLSVAAAVLGAEIAEQEIAVQKAGRLPTLDIVGDYGHRQTGGQFGDAIVNSGSIGMQLNVPIYSAGLISSRTRQAHHRHSEALARLEAAQRAALRQSRQAFLGIRADISSVKALEQAVLSSKTALESTQAGFEVGTRTAVDVVDAERGLFQARRDYARARYDYILDVLRLKQAAGTLSPEDVAAADGLLDDAGP